MAKVDFDEEVLEELTPETQLLSRVTKLKGNVIKLASFNQDELVELYLNIKGKLFITDLLSVNAWLILSRNKKNDR